MSEKDFSVTLSPIAKIRNAFPTKFGLPRQSGLAESLVSEIVFEPEYRIPEALRDIEQYSHLWLIWGFSEVFGEKWSPTVRPPRLGGNKRVGVFATRSPYRPNPIGLSCVKLLGIKKTPDGTVLLVSGADIMDQSPIYDIKPYLPYVDSHPEALGGFAHDKKDYRLELDFPSELLDIVPKDLQGALKEVLEGDPRPAYHTDDARIYGLEYASFEVKFKVSENILHVVSVNERKK